MAKAKKERKNVVRGEAHTKATFIKTETQKGLTVENMIVLLERRLDNVVCRFGFAASRKEARMMVTHGLFRVNGKKVDIPSYVVKTNDVVEVAEKKKALEKIRDKGKSVDRRGMPEWLPWTGTA